MSAVFRYTLCGLVAIFLFPQIVGAASLYIDPARSELHRGDSITMAVRLDTDEQASECINVIDATLKYSANIDPVDVSIGESIFSLWVERPTIDRTNRTITFAGGIPNGYCGRVAGDPRLTNVVTKIVFRSPSFVIGQEDTTNTGTVSFDPEVTTAYRNDAIGSKADLNTYGAEITLNNTVGSSLRNDWQAEIEADRQQPEKFSILLEKDDSAFNGKYYIVFNTTDKQTGIDSYYVMEEPLKQGGSFNWGAGDAPWVKITSPYVLKDQTLNSVVRVRAVDKAGNEYIATLIPDERLQIESRAIVVVSALFAGMLLVIIVGTVMFLRARNRRYVQHEDESEGMSAEIDSKHDSK